MRFREWRLFGRLCWWSLGAVALVVALGAGGAQAAGGTLDSSFGTGGKVLTGFVRGADAAATGIALQPDGKIVAAGHGGDWDFALARYTISGKLDPSFGSGGKVLTDLGDEDDQATAVAVQKDGKIVAAGQTGYKSTQHLALARYTTGGKLDPSFGNGGKVALANMHKAHAVVIQAQGRIVVANCDLIAFTAGGMLDRGFGRGGRALSPSCVTAMAVQKDGKIVAVGSDGLAFALVRYTADGKRDRSFGSGAKETTIEGDGESAAISVQKDGKIVVAGTRFSGDTVWSAPASVDT
jgi:uncharacterized delta-60 repeat protein